VVRWDDPAIRADNEGVRLPASSIQVVHRSDPSGTTFVFSSYLDAAAAGASWGLGIGRTVRFPRGQGAEGSSGVIDAVKRTAGAIGYVQLSYARHEDVNVALLGNRAGDFQPPSPDAVSAALDAATLRQYGTVVRLNFRPDSPGAYPLATVTYLMFSRTKLEPAKARAIRHLATWAMTEGQRYAEPLGYTLVPRQFRVPALEAVAEPPG
jgi:phosphate transport system substrate-binding protein